MIEVDAVKLMTTPGVDEFVGEEEPSEATVHLVGREEAFQASTSEEHRGAEHPVRQLLDVATEKFITWIDARGNTVVMNPKRLLYVEHPKYWIEDEEDWTSHAEEEQPAEAEAVEEEAEEIGQEVEDSDEEGEEE